MCGIAGIFHFADSNRPVDRDVLDTMTDSLAHRGPDGRGVWHAPSIGLGHRRLAIIDLTDNAAQPMEDAEGRLVITYNGEIYNFRELRDQLEAKGHPFRSSSDTEVILAAYREWGRDVVRRLSGIFAFAIWDVTHRHMFLARDPIGVKPLFYSTVEGTLRFGSEIKAILSDPAVSRDFDEQALDAFFTFSYTPAPATGFRHVRQLLPGHFAIVDRGGLRVQRYWDQPYSERAASIDFADAVVEFTEQFDRITKAQLVADVPVGAFLSGGLDSAAVVRAMKHAACGEVHALTVGFNAGGFDERGAARTTARSLGVALDEQEASLSDVTLFQELSRHMEEPTADSSMLPVYLVCRAASERFKVCMSGDGADEILAGYDTYRATAMAERYRRLPCFLRRGIIGPLARRLPIREGKYGLHQVATRFVQGAEMGSGRDHCAWRLIFHEELKSRLYSPELRARVNGGDPLAGYAACIDEVPAERDRLEGLLHADTTFYLPNDMLIKVDRMSMANGLEVRVPFLDVEMVRYAASLPADFKLHRRRVRKHILRESLRGSIPDSVLDRPKSGFNIPVERWMRSEIRELLFDTVSAQRDCLSRFLSLRELESVAAEHVQRRADHGHALFAVLMFALFLDNAASAWRTSQPVASVARA